VSRPELVELALPDPPERWAELGFTVEDGAIALGGVSIRLGATAAVHLTGLGEGHDLDGLPIEAAAASQAPDPARRSHPIGATAIDHVVVTTPDLERTTRKLVAAGFDHRPSRAAQEFFVLGPCLLELGGPVEGEPRLWGVTVVVEDIDAAARRAGANPPKQAIQPGRRIATVPRAAGLATALALMTPR
jgi:hypothetical protein